MAISSMHKPGWRSRRRSRLSLVERAVPRLGRPTPPDDTARPARADEPSKPLSPPPENEIETSEFVSNDVASPAQADGVLDVDGEQAAGQPAAVPNEHVDEAPVAEAGASPMPEPHPTPDMTMSGGEDERGRETSPATGSSIEPAAADDPEGVVDGGAAGESIPETPVLPPARHASSRLDIDWKPLVDSGFTDPRNRDQPLPEKMNEVVRALIRQALSDQASWRDRVILVTSPTERVCKTTSAINFAFGLTTVGDHHAVLVDVDTTGAGAVDRLGGGDRIGIAEALADDSIEIGDLVIATDLDRLTLVASGTPEDDTLDRFASRRMLQILRYLTEHPDTLLVIDAPPILVSQEAAVLSVIAGQVVLAVEAGRTTADQIEHALQRIGDRHNVSIALNENSGIVVRDDPAASASAGHRSGMTKREAPDVRRRLPKAAAALVGAMTLGVFALEPAASSRSVLSTPVEMPPERWLAQTGISTTPSERAGR